MSVHKKLSAVQSRLQVNKSKYNAFGKYNYRSCEDILEGVKPFLGEVGATLLLTDGIKMIGERFYIEATATFTDVESGESVQVCALAREDLDKKGMDLAQVTGSVSSYARKYALNGLFCIDDNKDSDATNKHGKDEEEPKKPTKEGIKQVAEANAQFDKMLSSPEPVEKVDPLVSTILDLMISTGAKDSVILSHYKVKTLDGLTDVQKKETIARLKNLLKAQEDK